MSRRLRAPASYDAATIRQAKAICEAGVPVLSFDGKAIRYRRPRLHPLVPHPGTGPGAIRMTARLLTKEATLHRQQLAREAAAVNG